MALERDSVQRPIRKLRKALKGIGEDSAVEQVHKLRTGARKLEAIITALSLDAGSLGEHLLGDLKPVRKAAGDVRDTDVLMANSLRLSGGEHQDCLIRLTEHLGNMRVKSAKSLYQTVAEVRKSARQDLKKYAKRVERQRKATEKALRSRNLKKNQPQGFPATSAATFALGLTAELSRWPQLDAGNVHPFRIKVKVLRYVLQLGPTAEDGFIAALGEVKDRIGEWHDWQQLSVVASSIIEHAGECPVRKQIEATEREKLEQALASANAMRMRYLGDEATWSKAKKPDRAHLEDPVMKSMARLAG